MNNKAPVDIHGAGISPYNYGQNSSQWIAKLLLMSMGLGFHPITWAEADLQEAV